MIYMTPTKLGDKKKISYYVTCSCILERDPSSMYEMKLAWLVVLRLMKDWPSLLCFQAFSFPCCGDNQARQDRQWQPLRRRSEQYKVVARNNYGENYRPRNYT